MPDILRARHRFALRELVTHYRSGTYIHLPLNHHDAKASSEGAPGEQHVKDPLDSEASSNGPQRDYACIT